MPDTPEDTDTLLAMLASTLPEPIPQQQVLLDALVQSNGNVEAAIRLFSSSASSQLEKCPGKRRISGLDGWLKGMSPPPSKRARSSSPRLQASSSTKPVSSIKPVSLPSKKPASATRSNTPLSTKAPVNLMEILRPPRPSIPSVPRFPPLTLSNPSMVTQHTPCTLHASVLPPELACELFYTMLHEAQSWQRNKWWLFDRLVESPHRTSFYVRNISDVNEDDGSWNQVSRFWYNGRETEPPAGFPAPMEKACEIIEEVVNAEMHKRHRFPLEWGGVPSPSGGKDIIWRANFAASNCYEGAKETVGFHSDRLTNIGPYATIASLSLGTSRVFRLREVIPVDEVDKRAARTYNIPLVHNSLVIMHASTQERFKHSVPPQSTLDRFHPAFPPPSSFPSLTLDPSNCRINITFRFYRPDFHPDKVPKCKCGLPTTLRPDMKKRQRERGTGKGPEQEQSEGEFRYWWTCTAGDQKEGKGCNFWKVMDVKAEGRGPFAKDIT